ncbi:LuxR C-terminal-related transcriptional regulator [Streptomyces sp. NPDC058001]|uniref:helix-turn-helix transcriptional regulator n=1 Tax=Streptomyces sp. NPDC058001 TaxID=3346300 RepID=UPI0036EEFDF8
MDHGDDSLLETGAVHPETGDARPETGAVDETTALVYRLRVVHPTDSVEELAARAGLTEERVARAQDRLAELCLLRATPGGGWTAISPETAAETLFAPTERDLLRRRTAMAAARVQLHALTGDYVAARGMRFAQSQVEVIDGIDNVRSLIDDLTRTCTESMDSMAPGGGHSDSALRAALPLDLALLARGRAVRTLLLHSARGHAPTADYAEKIGAAGALVRSTGVLPSRMLIYDRNTAVLPVDPEVTAAGAAVVREPTLVRFLARIYDHHWDGAVEFAAPQEDSGPELGALEREVLRLMAAGKKNEVIAHTLGMSPRSVSRVVAGLLARLDAESRFQAGVRAATNGWLDQ